MTNQPISISQVLTERARVHGEVVAYRIISSNGSESACITYADLGARVTQAAEVLSRTIQQGDRVLLMFNMTEHFIYAFYACLMLGAIAVPLKPVQRRESLDRLKNICLDCAPSILLTDSGTQQNISNIIESDLSLSSLTVTSVEKLLEYSGVSESSVQGVDSHDGGADNIAFIQYTSGSTGKPKGVMVSNANIMTNSEMIRRSFGYSEETVMVSWLPLFHDMGLIGGIIQPLYTGFTCVLMTPIHFMQRPMSWLNVISMYRATTAGAPNFAYDLCVLGFRERALNGVDLSSLTLLFNGAEPVKQATLEKFSDLYESYGFNRKAFTPCYGMAEATLLVSCKTVGENYRHVDVCGAELEKHLKVVSKTAGRGESVRVVSNGKPAPGVDVVILSTEEPGKFLPSEQIGQIAIKGANVTAGYWCMPSVNFEKFVHLKNAPSPGDYLLTGDIGFLLEGELYVIGRIDEMMIFNGRNVYPDSIEHTVEQLSDRVVKNGVICFQLGVGVVILVELVSGDVDADELKIMTDSICRLVFNDFNVSLKELHFVRKRSLPKTSSGKKMRKYCRNQFALDAEVFLSDIRVQSLENA